MADCRDSLRARLGKITECLLDPESDPGQLRDAGIELHGLLSELSGVGDDSDGADDGRESRLPTGTALSPKDAARCVLDFRRTVSFMSGIHAAIQRAVDRFPGRPIHLLYAGCGPYATLALPLTMRFPPEQMQLTLLDIHQRSIAAVQQIIDGLGLHDWIRGCITCDATDYVHPPGSPFHVLVIEAMQRALEKEPQVALTFNLARQLPDGGVLIPEEVSLTACLADLGREFALLPADHGERDPVEIARRRINLGSFLHLNARTEASDLRPAVFKTPEHIGSCNRLLILTRIRIFENFVLDDYDSGITVPAVVHDVGAIEPGDSLELSYESGPQPGTRTMKNPPSSG
jgi:hypothetical protein